MDRQLASLGAAGGRQQPTPVDIDWRPGRCVGAETQVSSVIDSLFYLVKLASAIAYGDITEGRASPAVRRPV